MKDETHKRMAGDYEIIQAIHIGDREIVLGEKLQSENGDKYMCAFCQQNELFAAYSEVMCSNNYAEMVKMFGERVTEQAEKTRVAMNAPKIQGIDDRPITASDCAVVSYEDDLNNKIVVIKPGSAAPGVPRATCQLKLCVGGFGAYPRSCGSACFCIDLYTGKESRYERMDVLGVMEPEKLPGWAKHGLLTVQQERAKKEPHKGEKEAR